MSTTAINAVRLLSCPNASTKLVLFVLANYADRVTSKCYPSLSHLGEVCGISSRHVGRSIKILENLGYISVTYRKGNSNIYHITHDAHVVRVTTRVSRNTLDIQNNKGKGGKNAIAG